MKYTKLWKILVITDICQVKHNPDVKLGKQTEAAYTAHILQSQHTLKSTTHFIRYYHI